MEYSLCSDKGIITTSSLSSSSRSGLPLSSSSPSTNYPPSPPAAVTSSPPSSSSSSSPNSPRTDLPPDVSSSPSSSRPVTAVVIRSCAACKFLGQICAENCVLATCFPPNDPIKFTTVHRVFGAGNIIKLLQELPESQRADTVSSMVYEANARLRDPVYGCVRIICVLQKQVSDLQEQLAKSQAEAVHMKCHQANLTSDLRAQLAKAKADVVNVQCLQANLVSNLQAQLVKAQADVVNMQCQQANLMAPVCTEMCQSPQASASEQSLNNFSNSPLSCLDDLESLWEPLWT